MVKKQWISMCENIRKDCTNTEQITWDSSSSEDELPSNKSPKKKLVTASIFSTKFSSESPFFKQRFSPNEPFSPELSPTAVIQYRVPSPEIQKGRVKCKRRMKIKQALLKSPQLFCCDPTQNIENESPNIFTLKSQCTVNIEQVPSQFVSPVKREKTKQLDNLYFQPPKIRRTYKKGGFAHHLHNILKCNKSRVKIWHHEKLKNVDNPLDKPEDIVSFKFKQFWIEYGVKILKCVFLDGVENNVPATFLIDLGVSQILNVEFECDCNYQLFPPYCKDFVIFNDENILYFFNVSKVIKTIKSS